MAIQVLTAPRYVPQTFRRALRGWWRRARQIATGVFAAGAPAAPRDIDLAVQLSPPRLAGLPHEQRIVAEVAPTRLAGTSDNAPRIQAQLSPDRMEGT